LNLDEQARGKLANRFTRVLFLHGFEDMYGEGRASEMVMQIGN
jgi:hypothetical protein